MNLNGIIQSIQAVEIVIATNASSNTATISSVNTANTVIFWQGQRAASATLNPSLDNCDITLTNGTTVTATTNAADTVIARTVCALVVEFKPGILQSVQYGTVTSNASLSQNATLATTVTASNAFVMYLGRTTNRTSYNLIRDEVALTLVNGTTVNLARGNFTAADSIACRYVVVEFVSGAIQSIQKATVNNVTATNTGTATISSVTPGNCLLAYGGIRQSVLGTSDSRLLAHVRLTDATTLTLLMNTASTSIANIPVTVVEFKTGWIKSKQTITNAVASGAGSHDETISSVNTALSLYTHLGFINSTDLNTSTLQYVTGKLQSSTAHRAEGGGTPATVRTMAAEVVEFYTPVQIDVPAGSLVLTPNACTFKKTQPVPLGSLTITGLAPSPTQGLPIPLGMLTLSLLTPGKAESYLVNLGALSFNLRTPIIPKYQQRNPSIVSTYTELGNG